MKKIELLLPAGNMDCLKAAVENGADAVYLGVREFNARRRADNFNLDNIHEAVNYAHANGVKIYCTLNILVKNSEIRTFFETIKKLYLANVDAIIIQHLSFLPIIKQNFPGLEVHLSTQTTITNSYFYDLIKEADKIVLPRELSKQQIQEFIHKTKLPTEIFVQGALCFSYSGKCLFSSFLGGRSGNRGLCAQPCRKGYNQNQESNNHNYLLSMKDLCLVEKIPEIIELGVSSLKIEGRLRNAKYVAAAAKLYRTAIDSYYHHNFNVDKELLKELELSFNREYTLGYYAEKKSVVSPERPMSRGLYLGVIEEGKLIHLQEDLEIGDGVGIWSRDKVDGAIIRKIEKSGKEVSKALRGEKVKLFVHALPGTKIYKTSSIKPAKKIELVKKEAINIPARKINKIIFPEIKIDQDNDEDNNNNNNSNCELIVKVYSKRDAQEALNSGADKVFYDLFAKDFSSEYGAYIPRILNDKEVEEAMELIKKHKVREVLIGDLGVYAKIKNKTNSQLKLYLDYSNNVFNDIDLDLFQPAIPVLSPELSLKELLELKNKNFAVLVHGKVVLMNTKYSSLPNTLKDEKQYVFPVRKEHSYYQILNSVEQGWFEEIKKLQDQGIKTFYLDLDHDVHNIVKLYREILAGKKVSYSKKHYTKGHLERGVV